MNRDLPLNKLTLIALFVALSAIGSYIMLPGPIGSVALDSAPGFIASILLGGGSGALVLGLGHILTAVRSGLPLGPIHLIIAVLMAGIAPFYSYFWQKYNHWIAGLVGIILNGFVINAFLIPLLGIQFFLAMIPVLTIGAAFNISVATLMVNLLERRFENVREL
ncbi:ECF transporter S component [Halanaerobiaceae bacterium Z-7014]|uniref:ECF transporter S component n=1 Tax=Halonatronomonas betaini TaxID=2778430 RepID=A0A931AT77_9FIRM|nr:ECF transporter S component [Halonatronomonas betaini]MBF8437466.1 ECF transporter S component [Halonatronomonas betaini]